MYARIPLCLLTGVALAAAGCDHRAPVAPVASLIQEAASAADQSSTLPRSGALRAHSTGTWSGGAQHLQGAIGPGALWAIDVPANWNGDLVLYAHGYTEEPRAIELPDIGYLRDPLLARGYAVAASSFSENGYALKEGAQQTHQLRGLFVSRFGAPRRTFLAGQSLGGIIALKLAETYPGQFDGALLGCGVVGGTREEIQFIGNVRVLFDYFYPGVLPGTLLDVPEGVDFGRDVVPRIVGAISANPQGAFAMTRLLPIPFASGAELGEAIMRALGFQFLGAADLLGRTHGHVFFDNAETVYTGALPQPLLDDLNARVARYQASPDAENFMRHNYEPSGRIEIPVLTLHTTRDPVVPAFNEARYGDAAGAAGCSQWLVQRWVNRFGHCTYSPAELLQGFDDLVTWADSGQKPAS